MKTILLTIFTLLFLFSIIGCVHEMSWEERNAQRKIIEKEAFWKAHPCYRLVNGDMAHLDKCLRPEERHSPEQFTEIAKQEARKKCMEIANPSPGCEEWYVREGYRSFAKMMCNNKPDWPDCEDYWMEFSAYKCRLPSPEELKEENEREERERMIDTLHNIDKELIDLNSKF
jgi:hypothetical protein